MTDLRPSRELYGNCRVHAPDGTLMFRTDGDLRDWYLSKGLAVENGPGRIDLTFQPKGPGHANEPYFLQDFQNRCVVCGDGERLSHHHIVPKCYRRHFPKDSYRYGRWMYDVLLVCVRCHERYEGLAYELKLKISREHGAADIETALGPMEVRLVKLSAALRRHGHLMPEARRLELEREFRDLSGQEPTEEALLEAWKLRHKSFTTSASQVVMSKVKVTDLDGFAMRWRLHFIRYTKPRFLPEGWIPEKQIYSVTEASVGK